MLGDASLRVRVGQLFADSGRAAGGAVPRSGAEPSVPEQVIPVRMRREARHNRLTHLGEVVGETGHLVTLHPRVDEQHAGVAPYDDAVALDELALVDQHTLRDLPQHELASFTSRTA